MTSMMEALSKAGFVTGDNTFVKYEKFSDVKLPFGSTVSSTYESAMTEFGHEQLDGINYLRETAEDLTVERLIELCPCIDKNNKYLEWMKQNVSNIKLINRGSCHENTNTGYLGKHTNSDERSYVADVAFGYADIVCRFEFNTQRMTIEPKFSKSTFNYKYQKELMKETEALMVDTIGFDYIGDDAFKLIKHFAGRMEFIPFNVSEFDGVTVSHKKYSDRFGYIEDQVTSPCLGINIKKYEKVMAGLSDFIASGGYIKDDIFYLIIQAKGKPDGTYYLRRYEEWSPRVNKAV